MGQNETSPAARYRVFAVLASIIVSIFGAAFSASSMVPIHDGRTAILLNGANLALFAAYLARTRDLSIVRLLVFGAAFGVIELLADSLCVRFTHTLDYSPARSMMVWDSPWWMPLAWAIVAAQVGFVGTLAIKRFGMLRGALLCAVVGAINIPFYEEMAFYAGWWRYVNCSRLGNTPLFIVIAELIIALALAPAAYAALHTPSMRRAAAMGALAGLFTIVGGIVGYGIVERIAVGRWL